MNDVTDDISMIRIFKIILLNVLNNQKSNK